MRDSNLITQYQASLGGGAGGSAMITTKRKFRDQHLTVDESDRGDTHALHCGLQGMGNGGREKPKGQDNHCPA